MSEEQSSDWKIEPQADSEALKKIGNIGQDPWTVRRLSGTVKFKRADAGQLQVTALDFNGYPQKPLGTAREIQLAPKVMYYLISR